MTSQATIKLMHQSINHQIRNCQMALSILEAAPESRIDLQEYARETECGTLFCALGWIARVPYFRAQRIFMVIDDDHRFNKTSATYWPTAIVGGATVKPSGGEFSSKLDQMFGRGSRNQSAWSSLFDIANESQYDDEALSHRDMALNRFRQHIKLLEAKLSAIKDNEE